MLEDFRNAVEFERACRDAAFLPVRGSVGGFSVLPLTLRHFLILRIARSPLLFNEPPDEVELAKFLWIVSPWFRPGRGFQRWLFLYLCGRRFTPNTARRRWRLRMAQVEARNYMAEHMLDAPGGSGKPRASYYSDAAMFCANIAREFGWDDDAILDKPLKRLHQYARIYAQRSGTPLFNSSDVYMRDFLNDINLKRRQSENS